MERSKFLIKKGERMIKLVYKEPTLIKMGRLIKETKGNQGSNLDDAGNLNNPNQNQPNQ